MGTTDRCALAFCLAALLYPLSGVVSRAGPKRIVPSQLTQLDAVEKEVSGNTFAPDAVSNLSRPDYVQGPLRFYGSFLQDGDTTGSIRTASYPAIPDFYMFVSGFPNRPGNRLLVEVKSDRGESTQLQVTPFEDPASRWLLKRISLRSIHGAKSFRIVALDGNKGPEGWLGFSIPFEDQEQSGRHGLILLKQFGFSLLAIAAAFVAVLAPGLLLRQKNFERTGKRFSLIWVAVPGLVGLALLGIATWISPPHLHANGICRYALGLFFAFALWRFWRIGFSTTVTRVESRVLLAMLLLIGICEAKSIYSLGPVGELFHDEISRTLEIGGRSDSRLPFYVAQLAGLKDRPDSPLGKTLYGTWTFSDRGQFIALAAVPLVLAGPTAVPAHHPGDVWTVFDPQGFAAYRYSMVVFAASCLLFVFGISRLFLNEDWALFAVLITASAPFVVHETYFTWPKQEAAAFVLLAGYLVLRSRFLLSGLALGLGYMCHPSALLSTPALFGLIVLLPKFEHTGRMFTWRALPKWFVNSLLMMIGLSAWLLLWRLVNGASYTQGKFLNYAMASGSLSHTAAHWLRYRWDSFINTLAPFYQFVFFPQDDNVNAIEGPSPAIVRFFVQPWSSVPAGVGFVYFFCLLRWVYVSAVKASSWFFLVLAVPLLIFTAYMGIDRSGMLKEGLHAWFLTLIVLSVVVWRNYGAKAQTFWRVCNWALLSRVIDLLCMMLMPVIWTQRSVVRPPFVLTDLVSLCVMTGATLGLCIWMFRLGETLRRRCVQNA